MFSSGLGSWSGSLDEVGKSGGVWSSGRDGYCTSLRVLKSAGPLLARLWGSVDWLWRPHPDSGECIVSRGCGAVGFWNALVIKEGSGNEEEE